MTGESGRGSLSLEQIEHDVWGDPQADVTRLVGTVHELRRKPVASLTPEDLRLARDPLAAGDFYPGDLLAAVMRLR